MPILKTPLLLVGLGNPGDEYARNRHNAGFLFVDAVAEHYRFSPFKKRFSGEISEGEIDGRKVHLLKPLTYMNLSGDSVGPAARFYKIPIDEIVVAHDEMDLEAGKLKVKTGGGDAGHNGLRSITAALGPDYRRVRIGVGHPGDKARVTGHVLQNFSKADLEWFVPLIDAMVEAMPQLVQDHDNGFTSKVALKLKPPVKKPDTREKKPDERPKE